MTDKITIDREKAQLVLEALVVAEEFVDRHSEDWYISGQQDLKQIRESITALREALAEQPVQEPVADDLVRKYVTAVVENKPEDAATILCSMVDYVFQPPSCTLKGWTNKL